MKYYRNQYRINIKINPTLLHKADRKTFDISTYLMISEGVDYFSFNIDKFIMSYRDGINDEHYLKFKSEDERENSLEMFANYIYEDLKAILAAKDIKLISLDISETVLLRYTVSDRIILPSRFTGDNTKRYRRLIELKEKFVK
ncbi:MAG: 6-carboxytetrahydropterin synthase [Lachnospiraceae bacterium]|nr:6-carboxytetrahydropterin synthase [Lachnospiraceae bacterium]